MSVSHNVYPVWSSSPHKPLLWEGACTPQPSFECLSPVHLAALGEPVLTLLPASPRPLSEQSVSTHHLSLSSELLVYNCQHCIIPWKGKSPSSSSWGGTGSESMSMNVILLSAGFRSQGGAISFHAAAPRNSHVRRWKELEESRVVCTCNQRNGNRCSLCCFLADGEPVRGCWS